MLFANLVAVFVNDFAIPVSYTHLDVYKRQEENAEIDDFKDLNRIELNQVSVKDSARHNLRQMKILKSYGEIVDTSNIKLHVGCNLAAAPV